MSDTVTFTAPCDRDGCARDCSWTQTREGGRAAVPAPHAPGRDRCRGCPVIHHPPTMRTTGDTMNRDDPFRTFVHIQNRNHFGPSQLLDVHIGRPLPGDRADMLTTGGNRYITEPLATTGSDYTPALTCYENELRALFEALNRFFDGGADDTRALRKDYDAERARVDLMLAALIERNRA